MRYQNQIFLAFNSNSHSQNIERCLVFWTAVGNFNRNILPRSKRATLLPVGCQESDSIDDHWPLAVGENRLSWLIQQPTIQPPTSVLSVRFQLQGARLLLVDRYDAPPSVRTTNMSFIVIQSRHSTSVIDHLNLATVNPDGSLAQLCDLVCHSRD